MKPPYTFYRFYRRQASGALLVLLAGLLAGCISVFPESEPAQLYRFGDSVSPSRATATTDPTFNVFLGRTEFSRAAAGDRILTVSGNEAAYIKGARWVTSAEDLFTDALRRGFSENPAAARLIGNESAARVDYLLSVQVQVFEARYTSGPDAAPDIQVEVRATLSPYPRPGRGGRAGIPEHHQGRGEPRGADRGGL